MTIVTRLASILLMSFFCCTRAMAADADDLEAMLHTFLAAAHTEAAHSRFWAEDLVYTSSDGSRFNKAVIMAGFEVDEAADAPSVAYSAVEVDIRVYGNTAIVAFKLVGTPASNAADATVLNYLNTGTFLKRDGIWKVVAWQATKIPPA